VKTLVSTNVRRSGVNGGRVYYIVAYYAVGDDSRDDLRNYLALRRGWYFASLHWSSASAGRVAWKLS
jgi:hypothetical protein